MKTHHFRLLGILIAILALTTILTGCKETTSEPSPTNGGSEPENVQTQPVAPAKVEIPTTANVAESPTIAPAQPKKSLVDVLRTARTWGFAREFAPLIGKEAPDFTLTDIAGKKHKLSDYRGKNVILNFWATWCPPCKMTIPHMIELRKTVGEDKLAIMALSYVTSYPPNTAEMIKNLATEKKFNYPVFAVGGEGAGNPYDSVQSLPTIFFIDPEGKIKIAIAGMMSLNDFNAILEAEWPEEPI